MKYCKRVFEQQTESVLLVVLEYSLYNKSVLEYYSVQEEISQDVFGLLMLNLEN